MSPQAAERKYSVRFLRLQMPNENRANASAGTGRSIPAPSQPSAKSQTSANSARSTSHGTSGEAEAAAPIKPVAVQERHPFQLPPQTHVQPVTQTIVQMDLPPQILLKHTIPLPTVVLWNQTKPAPPMRKQFVAPPAKKIATMPQSLPVAVALDPPNQEIEVANVNVAASILNNVPKVVLPPSVASPVSSPGEERAKEIPQIGLASSSQPSAANLISLPNTPLRSANLLGIPPVNQISPNDVAKAGSSAGDGAPGNAHQGSGELGAAGDSGAGVSGKQGTGNGGASSGLHAGSLTGAGPGGADKMAGLAGAGSAAGAASAGGAGRATASTSTGGTGTAALGNGADGRKAGSGNGSDADLGSGVAGLTRINLPKDGKFGVVVLGSSTSSRYPQVAGALSGKVVYTVYLRVGLRKNWILQYCLPKTVEKGKGTAVAIDAPWPFLIMRPDRWSASDPDYIMVHGMLTAAGRFDQLAMVFPEELDNKDLLLNSLKLWDFRPASRDGEPTAVEVLLIIPREVE